MVPVVLYGGVAALLLLASWLNWRLAPLPKATRDWHPASLPTGVRDGRDGRCLGYARGTRCRCIGVRLGGDQRWPPGRIRERLFAAGAHDP